MKKSLLLGATALALSAVPAFAETNDKEIGAFAKILSLSKDVPAGNVEIAVVYDAGSKADLDALQKIAGGGFKGPKHTITFKGVDAASAASAASSQVVWLAEGLGADAQAAVLGATKGKKVLTVSSDASVVEAGNAVLGVDIGSAVKIVIHSDNYKQSGLTFDAAFEFMVKQI